MHVSALTLGTMTFGEQNSEVEAHQQLDYAYERGINFIDTAEMYPVPPRPTTYTLTEQYIGRWNKLKTHRDQIILATKVVGPMEFTHYIRDGKPKLNRVHIETAIEGSLKRLGVDYIDLYQLHWPDRNTNFFGQRGYNHQENDSYTPMEETLQVLADLQKSGKVRAFGLSNETPWGAMRYLNAAEKNNWPRMMSIQNPYNLLNRTFEIGLAEIAHRENLGLLAYSPMAFGALSGKYLDGQFPEGARLTRWKRFDRYSNKRGVQAIEKYCQLAKDFDMTPAQLALAYVTGRPFVTSNIIGATTLQQLEENINSIDRTITPELEQEIDKIHEDIPNPCP